MKRVALTTTATVAGLVLLLSLKPHEEPEATASRTPAAEPRPSTSASGTASASPEAAEASGAFTGDTVNTERGPVQVKVTLDRGRIAAVDVLQGVHEGGPSADAVPKLKQATLTEQSADIDSVSGATYTSEGYITSLQSALDRADA
ncbi:FMN-binding protein [Streptomyces sp. NPDC048639]|uniref:FMN-binding protein n=1 Tax=Streptomyces sp. NPDC048639 TaxID=3365581 RepID=UPI0037245057